MHRLTLAAVLSALLMFAASHSTIAAELVYNVRVCTASDPCDVQQVIHGTGSVFSGGPTNDDFIAYYAGFPGVDSSTEFSWNIFGASASGASFGLVFGPSSLAAYFIFNGGIVCCHSDNIGFNDINDNNLLIGGNFELFDDPQPISLGILVSASNPLGFNYSLTPEAEALLTNLGYSTSPFCCINFLAIDNDNRILAECSEGCAQADRLLQFDPVAPTPVPEPSSLLMMGMVLAALGYIRRRRTTFSGARRPKVHDELSPSDVRF
jgi:hypothetical protein